MVIWDASSIAARLWKGNATPCHNALMAVSRADRRRDRMPSVVAAFGDDRANVALDLLELTELAWHDCYGEVTPPEDIIADILVLSEGSVERLVQVALLAVTDWRDLRVAADAFRSRG